MKDKELKKVIDFAYGLGFVLGGFAGVVGYDIVGLGSIFIWLVCIIFVLMTRP